MSRKYSSISVDTTLSSQLTAAATTATVASATNLLGGITLGAGETFTVALAPDTANEEVVVITAVAGNSLTITRAQGGTSAKLHESGTTVRHVLTSIELTDFETVKSNYISKTTINAKGDLLVGTANDTIDRVGIGTNNYLLVADSGTTPGLKWTNDVTVRNLQLSVATSLGTTGTIDLDFATEGFKSHSGNLTGNITYTASNYAAGRSVTVRVPNGSTTRTLTFPTNWVFVGTKPSNIAASKTGILTVTSFGTTEADCVAAWAVQA